MGRSDCGGTCRRASSSVPGKGPQRRRAVGRRRQVLCPTAVVVARLSLVGLGGAVLDRGGVAGQARRRRPHKRSSGGTGELLFLDCGVRLGARHSLPCARARARTRRRHRALPCRPLARTARRPQWRPRDAPRRSTGLHPLTFAAGPASFPPPRGSGGGARPTDPDDGTCAPASRARSHAARQTHVPRSAAPRGITGLGPRFASAADDGVTDGDGCGRPAPPDELAPLPAA